MISGSPLMLIAIQKIISNKTSSTGEKYPDFKEQIKWSGGPVPIIGSEGNWNCQTGYLKSKDFSLCQGLQ